jgi:hypothetical protein
MRSMCIGGTLDGGICNLSPIDDVVFRRLYSLHTQVRLPPSRCAGNLHNVLCCGMIDDVLFASFSCTRSSWLPVRSINAFVISFSNMNGVVFLPPPPRRLCE